MFLIWLPAVAVLGGTWVGHAHPDFWLPTAWIPQFCAEFQVQVRLIDIYSR